MPVVTIPDAPDPAAGILKVCVEPEDTILNSVPDVPVASVCTGCVDALSPLSDEIPAPVEPPVLVIVITFGE